MNLFWSSRGLIGRLIAILLLTTLVEFGISTLLYERASQFSVRDDEARRLAEHLVIAERLLNERTAEDRASIATELTTDRYLVRWSPEVPLKPSIAPALDEMRQQVLAWEPGLRDTGMRLWLVSPGKRSVVAGAMRLADKSWLSFQTLHPLDGLNLGRERILLAFIPALGLLLLGGLLVRLALKPLRRLAIVADRVGHGVEEHLPEQGPAEVAIVIRAFNQMQDRIHQLIENRTQALAAVGHDFRTPLARLRLRAETVADADGRRAIEADIAEMEAMIDSLLSYLGGDEDPEPKVWTDVAVLCETLADAAADRGHDVSYWGPPHLDLMVGRLGLKRAVGNLVDNAVHHASKAVVRVATDAGTVTIAVEDNGPGLPEDMLKEVLKPFVRFESARPRDTIGFGLGLSIVAREVEREGGEFRLRNRPEGGLSAEIRLQRPSNNSLQSSRTREMAPR